MVKRGVIAGTIFCLLTIGCVSTDLKAFRDPDFAGKKYQRILVQAGFSDLNMREAAETAFVERINKHAAVGIPSLSVFMPTRNYTADELGKIFTDQRIDAMMFVILTDAYTSQSYIPGGSTTTGQATQSGNTINYSAQTQNYGGHYVSKPRAKYEIQLFDIPSGKKAWIATSHSRGNAFADFGNMITSLADSVVDQLQHDGLLKK
jgi:hypothetical protein